MKLAVLIEGEPNSGKTSTIRTLVNNHGGKNNKQMRPGWQGISLNSSLPLLRLGIYCIPSSPSETDLTLSNFFKDFVAFPNVLLLAVQPGGKHYKDTIQFLNNNGYDLISFNISGYEGRGLWEKTSGQGFDKRLEDRAVEIIKNIRKWVKSRNII